MDVDPGEAVEAGDWVATRAGSRYLVLSAHRVQRREHHQQPRYRLRCERLPKGEPIPDDVHVWWCQWYKR